jgi:hypothetical protein
MRTFVQISHAEAALDEDGVVWIVDLLIYDWRQLGAIGEPPQQNARIE